jgi:serine/threonine-protein kinase
MNRMFYTSLVAVMLLLSATAAAYADQYAAIAYSPSTGNIGYSYNCCSLAEARRLALDNCDGEDADVVTWARNAYCALALGDDAGAYGTAWGRTRAEAESLALQWCSQNTTNGYIARWVYSGCD